MKSTKFCIWPVLLGLTFIAFAHTSIRAQDQNYPDRPIRLIVPFPPGGASANIAQLLSQKLSISLGSPVVLDFKVGAGGMIAGELAAKAQPNGYTILFATGALNINDVFRKTKRYDFGKDLVPIIEVAQAPFVMLVNPKSSAKSASDFAALAKKAPGNLNFGSGGAGAVTHLAGELFKAATSTDIAHVPFNGEAPALAALMGGQVDVAFTTLAAASGQIAGKTLRPLGVLSSQRSALAPEVPTMTEQGIDVVASTWYALMAPAGTPVSILERLQLEAAKTLADEEIRTRITGMGAVPSGGSTAKLKELIGVERIRWKKLAETSGITMD